MIPWLYKFFIWSFLVLGMAAAYGQSGFIITATAEKINDGDSLFLAYKEDGQFILKSTTAKNKKFSFSGSVTKPVKAYISRNENPNYASIISESVEVYLEPGIITINSPDTLTGAIVSGTGLNDTLQLLQQELEDLIKRRSDIKDPDLFTEEEQKDTALVNYNKKALENIFYRIVDRQLEFAKRHPSSYVSLDILFNSSRINTYIERVALVYNQLAENLKHTDQGIVIEDRISKKRQVVPGMKAIDFSMEDNTGKEVSLSSFSGKYLLLDFWASWCIPCREEHPNLIQAYQKFKDKGFTILSVSIDTDKASWINAISKDKLLWTQVSDLMGDKSDVYLGYGITSIPANFLIDPKGQVIAKDLKGEALTAELLKIFPFD